MIIQFIAPFLDHSGYGEASRNTLIAMNTAGIKITTKIVSFTPDKLDLGEASKLALNFEKKYTDFDINLIELSPEHFPIFRVEGKYNIGYFFWEVKGIDKRWVDWCNLMDEIWLPSPMFAKMFKDTGVTTSIRVVPCCMDMENKYQPLELFFDKKAKVIFYSIFQWTQRKNPKALLETYWKTFAGIKDVVLIIKTYRSNFSDKEKDAIRKDILSWKQEIKQIDFPKVFLALGDMTTEEIMRLHATGDIFVSTHRGEGWGYPQMSAMAAKNLVISTNFGGIHEYLSSSEAMMPGYKLINVWGMEHILWYHSSQKWADINTAELSQYLREAYQQNPKVKKLAEAGQKFVLKEFNYRNVGKKIAKIISSISKNYLS